MAAEGVESDSMFNPSLIAELATHADPASGTVIARKTAMPPKKTVILGEDIRCFEMAHAALARLRYPLPDRSAEAASPADRSLLACGAILYWLNREDLSQAERRRNCAGLLAILTRHESGVAAAVIGEFFRSDLLFSESAKRLPGLEPVVTSFGQYFPDEVAEIYRTALKEPSRQTGYFEYFLVDDLIEKALAILGCFGSASDIPLLRLWSKHPRHGYPAVLAIKTLEQTGPVAGAR
jgi:hypothetical protein